MLACLYTGLLMGIIYDLTRLLCFGGGRLLTSAADAVFWFAACGLMLSSLTRMNGLNLRLFNFMFIALGFRLYRLSFSKFFSFWGRKAAAFLSFLAVKISKLLK